MKPEQEKQFNELLERVKTLETASNNDTNELIIENLIKRRTDVDDSKIADNKTITITIDGTEYSAVVQTPAFPDDFIEIKYKGKLYRIPAYNAQRFV